MGQLFTRLLLATECSEFDVGAERMVPDSLDQNLPAQFVGRLRTEILDTP